MCRFWCVQNRSKNVEGVDHFECKCAPFGRLLCRPWTRFGTDFEPDLGPILNQIWSKTGTKIGPKLVPDLDQNWYQNWSKTGTKIGPKLVPELVATGYRNWSRRGTGIGRDGVPELGATACRIWYYFANTFGTDLEQYLVPGWGWGGATFGPARILVPGWYQIIRNTNTKETQQPTKTKPHTQGPT